MLNVKNLIKTIANAKDLVKLRLFLNSLPKTFILLFPSFLNSRPEKQISFKIVFNKWAVVLEE